MSRRCLCLTVFILAVMSHRVLPAAEKAHPLSEKQRAASRATLEKVVKQSTAAIAAAPSKVAGYSRRGDALFFLGRFKEAVADYDKMVELDAALEKPHWRRGIAWFYAKQYKQAAHQFEIYNSFDNVDRENGIWRFFSQARAYDIKTARKGLLKYKKDDREPFPDVYKLFSEELTGKPILKKINAAKISDTEREKRLFYAQLYIGLNHALHDRDEKAVNHLRAAVANTWGPKAGYGPHYMWQVGRLHYELLTEKLNKKSKKTKE